MINLVPTEKLDTPLYPRIKNSDLNRIGLGTVQFGLNYGISNRSGQTPIKEVSKILQCALESNITTIDTASTYGNSEEILGHSINDKRFDIVTKTIPTFKDKINSRDIQVVSDGVFESLIKLKSDRLDGLLVHHCDDLMIDGGGALFRCLNDLKAQNLFSKLGVSVYSVDEIEFVLRNYDIDLIQIPMNVFDQRLLQSGMLKKLQNSGVEVHVRSAFLQGLVFMDPQKLPPNLAKHSIYLTKFISLIKELEISPATACLAFLMQQPEIKKVICGVNSVLQLQQLIQTVSSLPQINKSVFDTIAVDNDNFLNPSNW